VRRLLSIFITLVFLFTAIGITSDADAGRRYTPPKKTYKKHKPPRRTYKKRNYRGKPNPSWKYRKPVKRVPPHHPKKYKRYKNKTVVVTPVPRYRKYPRRYGHSNRGCFIDSTMFN